MTTMAIPIAHLGAAPASHSHSELYYCRTPEGQVELASRSGILSPRLRQLLVLIGQPDGAQNALFRGLATPERLQALLSLGFISSLPMAEWRGRELPATPTLMDTQTGSQADMPAQWNITLAELSQALYEPHDEKQYEPQQVPQETPPPVPVHAPATAKTSQLLEVAELPLDGLPSLQHFMSHCLQQACGLLAASQMMDIDRAHDLQMLGRLQARWKMTLLDSRYDRIALERWIARVRESFQLLQGDY